jgi:aspartate aminotransferase
VIALGLGNLDVLPLWFGETDLNTPGFIKDAAIKTLTESKTFYTNARGIQPLREADIGLLQAHGGR